MLIYCFSLTGFLVLVFSNEDKLMKKLEVLIELGRKMLGFEQIQARAKLGQKLSSDLLTKTSSTQTSLPKYKFYTALLEEIYIFKRQLGTSQEQNLKGLRLGLIQDGKFEKKIQAELLSGYWQFIFITAITWLFVYLSLVLLDRSLMFGLALKMVTIQSLGLLCFGFTFHALKKHRFAEYEKWFFALYSLKTFLQAAKPVSLAIKESGVGQLFQSKKVSFLPLRQSLEEMIFRLTKDGAPIQEDLKFCLDELWFKQECDFEAFLKHLMGLKLMIILVFFLGAYFLYLYSFISTFMGA